MSVSIVSTETLIRLADKFEVNPVFLEKDWYTQHVLGVISKFELIFSPSIFSLFLTRPQNSFI
jgi:hypothetical protein